jgi:hypothetical protein
MMVPSAASTRGSPNTWIWIARLPVDEIIAIGDTVIINPDPQ